MVEDAPALFAMYSDPRVMRYWSYPPWTSIEQAQDHIAKDLTGLSTGEYINLAIVSKDTGILQGNCCLFAFSAQCRRAEMGYGLIAEAWGKGYMQEALTALINFGFNHLELNRIEADVDPRNEGSTKLLQRLGFLKEGYLRQRWIVADEVSDSEIYGLLRSDWQGIKKNA